jgi:DNA-directed RNA polymerase specialized sigma24 family protein
MDRPDRTPGSRVDPAHVQPDDQGVELDDPGEPGNDEDYPDYDGEQDHLIGQWLGDRELTAEQENLQRLVGDEELMLELQLHGFAGRPWERFAREMARYGMGVISSWIRRGVIYGRVKALTGFGLGRRDGWPDAELCDDLATDTVVVALDYFRERVLRAGRWQASRGASLGTFFIGQCLYRFANVYTKALRAEINRQEHREIPDAEMPEEWFDPIRGIEAEVVARQDVADALAQVSTERARQALVLKHIGGYSYEEIAERLGMTDARQIGNMLDYQRAQRRQRRSG